MKDLYSSQGKLFIVNQTPLEIFSTISIDYAIDDYNDIIYEVKSQQSTHVTVQLTAIVVNGKFQHFDVTSICATTLVIQCTGNLQNILGIHQDITLTTMQSAHLSDDNSMRIEYIKILSEHINGSMQTFINAWNADKTMIQKKTEFEDNTLVVLTKNTKFQYANKNLDVHLQLLKNPPLVITIVD